MDYSLLVGVDKENGVLALAIIDFIRQVRVPCAVGDCRARPVRSAVEANPCNACGHAVCWLWVGGGGRGGGGGAHRWPLLP